MWEPRRLTTPRASTACHRNSYRETSVAWHTFERTALVVICCWLANTFQVRPRNMCTDWCCHLSLLAPVNDAQFYYSYVAESSTRTVCFILRFFDLFFLIKKGYEEWRLLGYKNPVRTSQETHYFSTTESSQLMLCKI
jgi:hypothetical protein